MKLSDSILEELWFGEEEVDSVDAAASSSMAAKLAELEGLRPFPAVAQRVLGLLANPSFRIEAIEKAVEEDPALAAKVLRIANSAAFATRVEASSVREALVRLGANTVMEVVVAVATLGMFLDAEGVGRRIRDHCASTAAIVRLLALEYRQDVTKGIFLCGLMHDLGKLLLIQSGELPYRGKGAPPFGLVDRVHLYERREIGYDHAVLGGHVLTSWRLPEPIPKVVAWHHQPARAYAEGGTLGATVAILRLADQIDPLLRLKPEAFDKFAQALADKPECQYLQLTGQMLVRMWEPLYHARAGAVSLYG